MTAANVGEAHRLYAPNRGRGIPAEFVCGVEGPTTPLSHSLEHTIGSGHAPIALRVGGLATANNPWIAEFLTFCEDKELPTDFVSTYYDPTDAFGEPGDDTATRLAKSRSSVLREQAQDTRRRARGRPVNCTEWNTSSNPRDPLHDEPYAAAFVVKTVVELPTQSVAAITLELTMEPPDCEHG